MNTFWLKIAAGLVGLALVVIIGVSVFWPAETRPIAESNNVDLTKQESMNYLAAPVEMQRAEIEHAIDSTEPRWAGVAELGRPELQPFRESSLKPPDVSHGNMADLNRQTIELYLDDIWTKKSRKLLSEMSGPRWEKPEVADRQTGLPYPTENSRELLRRLLGWDRGRLGPINKEKSLFHPRSSRTDKARELLRGVSEPLHRGNITEDESSEKLRQRLLERYKGRLNTTDRDPNAVNRTSR